MQRIGRTCAVIGLAPLLVACSLVEPTPTVGPVGPLVEPAGLALPTTGEFNGVCAGVGLVGARLAGDREDSRLAWIETPDGRIDVVFPPGFTAKFAPDLVIVNASGQPVLREGDPIDGGCVIGSDVGDPLLIPIGWGP